MSLGLDESKGKEAESGREVDASYRTLRIIWLAILAGVIALFIVTRLIQPSGDGRGNILIWSLWSFGALNFLYSFAFKYSWLKKAVERRKPEMVRSAYIVAFAICETNAVFGLVAHVVTGVGYYYFFFVIAGFGILMHKPQRDDLLAAYAGGGVWEARKND